MDATPYAAAWKQRFQRSRDESEKRRHEALEAAARCSAILRDRYHAVAVIVFGSVLRPMKFRVDSDLDMAVDGLEPTALLKAEVECCRSAGMEVQLVDLASVAPAMRERILAEGRELT